jgi:hypothetical protein
MDQDDAEKRIADLKRPYGKQRRSDLRPAQLPEPQPTNAAAETGSGDRKPAGMWNFVGSLWNGLVVAFLGVASGLPS